MAVPRGPIRNTRMGNDDLSRTVAPLEAYAHKFGRSTALVELPCIGKAMWGLNKLELADDPDDMPVRKLVGDAISTSYAQVNLRSYTRDALGAPPLLKLGWFCP